MNNNNNHIKNYSAEDISRYWQGKMSPQEMHDMEMGAVDDPFLADAMDGYATADAGVAANDMNELQQRLRERVSGAEVIAMRRSPKWWRAAAILILLAGASALTYKLVLQPAAESTDVAALQKKAAPVLTPEANKPQETTSASTAAGTDSNITAGNAVADSVVVTGNVTATKTLKWQSDSYNSSTSDAVAIQTEPKPVPDLSAYKPKDANKNLSMSELREKMKAKNDSVFIATNDHGGNAQPSLQKALQGRADGIEVTPNARSVRQMENNQMLANNFSGRVVDQNNNAIPFASVRANNSNITSTNRDGYFTFRSPDTVVDLSVTSLGYVARNLTLRGNQPPPEVVLEPSNAKLEEVVVKTSPTSYKKTSSKERDDTDLDVLAMDAQPVAGWEEYNKYLEQQKNPALLALKGDVIVSFQVDRNGQLSSFKIERSLGKEQDQEAIRLVKQGPAWKLRKGKKGRAMVKVSF